MKEYKIEIIKILDVYLDDTGGLIAKTKSCGFFSPSDVDVKTWFRIGKGHSYINDGRPIRWQNLSLVADYDY